MRHIKLSLIVMLPDMLGGGDDAGYSLTGTSAAGLQPHWLMHR